MQPFAALVRQGNRRALSKALTLVESTKPEHQAQAMQLLDLLYSPSPSPLPSVPPSTRPLSHTQRTVLKPLDDYRIGISGPPGAGKSSLIEALGCAMVCHQHQKVAVLAIDPSSDTSGGAILGDKTRMAKLSRLDQAFVRPSPSRGSLGGVARSTTEALAICAAAGYTRILVETVGVGQSEIAVADLVDCMVLVLPPVGGDDLQSIKRGITEVADIVVVNKADGATKAAAALAAASFRATMHLRPLRKQNWVPVVMPVSAHTGEGIEELRIALDEYWNRMRASGELRALRGKQRRHVAWTAAQDLLLQKMKVDDKVQVAFNELLPDITEGRVGPRMVARSLVDCFLFRKNDATDD